MPPEAYSIRELYGNHWTLEMETLFYDYRFSRCLKGTCTNYIGLLGEAAKDYIP